MRLVLLMVLALPHPAAAEEPLPRGLREGIEAYTQVDYAGALLQLRSALQRSLTAEQQAIAYFYLGCTYLGMEDRAQARQAFETLLAIQPGYLPDPHLTSPKIAGFLAEVRESYPVPETPPSLAHRPPAAATPGNTHLQLQARGLSPRLRVLLRYRPAGVQGYSTLEAGGQLGSRFEVPTPSDGSDLLYYFLLRTSDGVVVQRLGSPTEPFRLPVRRGQPGSAPAGGRRWYRSWWFWSLAGAVAVGAGVGLGVGLTRSSSVEASVTILRRDAAGHSVPIFSR